MSVQFPEPKTEDEAQRIRRFLQVGGEVAIKLVETFKAEGSLRLTLAQPGTLKFSTTGDRVVSLANASADRRIKLTLDITEIMEPGQFSAAVFINKHDASAQTTLDDPGFAGALGFFVHSADQMGPTGGTITEALRYELDITTMLKRLQRPSETLTTTVALLPINKSPSPASQLVIGTAS